jgi:hypothetical protein
MMIEMPLLCRCTRRGTLKYNVSSDGDAKAWKKMNTKTIAGVECHDRRAYFICETCTVDD